MAAREDGIKKMNSSISEKTIATLLAIIPKDKDYPITRDDLARLSGLSDRSVRIAIQEARSRGHMIVSSTKSAGYYYTTDPAEIKRYISQQEHYIMNISRGLNAFRKYVSIPVGQMEFKG